MRFFSHTQEIACEKEREKREREEAARGLKVILNDCVRFSPEKRTMVVYDTRSELAAKLLHAYQSTLSNHTHNVEYVDFDSHTPEDVREKMNSLSEGEVMCSIQSDAFQIEGYRHRLSLFQRNVKVVEHVHLALMPPRQHLTYLRSLAFHPHGVQAMRGRKIKNLLDVCERVTVECSFGHQKTSLVYSSPMEMANLNVGDYFASEVPGNVGGTFPIGEVFCEAKSLSDVNGDVILRAYPDIHRTLAVAEEPFRVSFREGKLVECGENTPQSFLEVLDVIRTVEDGEVLLREFGLGLNSAMSFTEPLQDITAFERMEGLHLSLGKKHTVYRKAEIRTRKTRMHIDVFALADKIVVDDTEIYRRGEGYVVDV